MEFQNAGADEQAKMLGVKPKELKKIVDEAAEIAEEAALKNDMFKLMVIAKEEAIKGNWLKAIVFAKFCGELNMSIHEWIQNGLRTHSPEGMFG